MLDATIRARAPLRIAFGGGGTDVSPYADTRGGLVLNATVHRHAHVTLAPTASGQVRLRSLDYDETLEYAAASGPDPEAEPMKLAAAVARAMGVHERRPGQGFDLLTHTDAPPGSGLGSSSAVVVALIGAFERWLRTGLDRYEMARLAYRVEREDLGMHGGRQDQYAAAFGGVNFMEFHGADVLVNPLRIPDETIWELEASLVLAWTGRSRLSSAIIEGQIRNVETGAADALEAMDRTKALALDMKRHLLTGDLHGFGETLDEAWHVKQRMAGGITTPHIDQIYQAAKAAGALGGKVSGAGGGGFMFFFADVDRRHAVVEAVEAHGAEVVHFGFTNRGLETWTR
ncbi:MAG: GHMP kinase [Bacteroidota bacterium]